MAAAPTFEKRVVGSFDGWVLLREPLELLRGEQRVRLQELPLRILEQLLLRPAELVTRDELVSRLWPTGVVEFDAGLNTAVRKLRAALGDDADAPRYIETVPRQGYRFIGRLNPQTVEAHDATALLRELPAEHGPAAPAAAAADRIRAPRRRLIAVAAAALLAVAALVGLVLSQIESVPSARPSTSNRYRMAVLPFDNLSPDPSNAFFADGMHEEVLSALAGRAADLEVISRATMMSYRTAPATTKDIARDLAATHVLEGTVRREGDRVRVTVRLVDAREDEQLWTETFDSELSNAMTLQADIATRVAAQLAIKLSTRPTQLPPSPNREAYDLWLKGALAWQTVGASELEIERVEAMFSRAIDLDPSYAAAYADRARVRMAKFDRGIDVSEANVASVRADLAAARRLAGDLPHVLVREATLATLVDRDVGLGLALIARAEQAGPLSADFLMTKPISCATRVVSRNRSRRTRGQRSSTPATRRSPFIGWGIYSRHGDPRRRCVSPSRTTGGFRGGSPAASRCSGSRAPRNGGAPKRSCCARPIRPLCCRSRAT